MQLDSRSSERLSLLRFPLVVGVVFIHAYETEVGLASGRIGVADTAVVTDFIRNLLSQGVGRLAVPLFFLMAGYLFHLGFRCSWAGYRAKLASRARSLLIPFLFWNAVVLAFFAVAQRLPATQAYFSGRQAAIASYGLYDYLNALLGFDRPPVAYPFWFIRDLMVMVVLTPVVCLLLRVLPRLTLGVVLALWYLSLSPFYVPSVVAMAWFYAGAWLASSGRSLFALDRHGPKIVAAYVVVLIADTLSKAEPYSGYLHRLGIVLGVASALYLSGGWQARPALRRLLLALSGLSFFVFALHEPMLTLVRKLAYRVFAPSTDAAILLAYLTIPLVVIAVACAVYGLLRRLAPRPLAWVSGGR